MSGFLASQNLAETPDLDFSIPDGAYAAMITGSKLVDSRKFTGDKQWQITYAISEDEDESAAGKTISEWYELSESLPANRKPYLKRRLTDLGFGPDDFDTMEPEDVLGLEVTITVKSTTKDGETYTNVKKVALGAASPSDDSFLNSNF